MSPHALVMSAPILRLLAIALVIGSGVTLVSCHSLGGRDPAPGESRRVATKEAVRSVLSRLEQPDKTIIACTALYRGDPAFEATEEMRRGPTEAGVPQICRDLEKTSLLGQPVVRPVIIGEPDAPLPDFCDPQTGMIDTQCVELCLLLSDITAAEDESIDDWRDRGEECTNDCTISCDGTTKY